ncbi:MAG: succinate dehydrogenase, hydrophobic membrane anchor protein [Thermomonas sp.]|uniref:succinate dehydrogenase, hydrophobic membrane anchor protein n=1 Tax=Thermomonas sp. TaxID=1971895 RepID=UPI001EB3F9AE|nr:succinate dehydrogenase, hydrophobic membrane anchor protein [Thermomonas sp.]MBV2208236.1 succinate dehydrogenase, hydrophobic membrane anchor protein [Thermomonas sp.]
MSWNANDMRTPLKRARNWGSAKDGTNHFIWQRVTAVIVALTGLWLLVSLLTLGTSEYAYMRAFVADPINAAVLMLFLVAMFWHAKLGLQVVIEDYVHKPLNSAVLQVATILICALAAIASVLAVLRIALGS